jgi:hypothetical protein
MRLASLLVAALVFALLLVSATLLLRPSTASAGVSIQTFTVAARNADDTVDELAASRPFALDVRFSVSAESSGSSEGLLHVIRVRLPPGLAATALAVPRCSLADFEGLFLGCGPASEIGLVRGVAAGLGQFTAPAYNLQAPWGSAAAFGVTLNGKKIIELSRLVGTGGEAAAELSAVLPSNVPITDVEEELWGVPADPAHDDERTCPNEASPGAGCPSSVGEASLITLPASCSNPLQTVLTATSYDQPPITAVAAAFSADAGGNPRPLAGCEAVPFEPRFAIATEGAALAPSGVNLGLEVPQYGGTKVLAAASLAALRLEFPDGLVLNPAAGAWLSGCFASAVGLQSAPGVSPADFNEDVAGCPGSSKLGSVKLSTPLVDHQLEGSIYLADPSDNPFGVRFAIYLVVEDPVTGTVLKIPGRLDADPSDGRLTAVIPEMPQLPFSQMQLEFAGGPQGLLVDPARCGDYATEATFTPSTAPFSPPVTRTSAFTVSGGPGGGPCPAPEAQRSAMPSFQAGTEAALSGRDSSLVINLSREDTAQHFGSFALTFPPGLVANLGSTAIGAEVGSARVEAGVGSRPLVLGGKVYLDGPYGGAPYSLRIVVPAQVGPFDLGMIVERVAVDVDPATAQVSVRADPLPQILAGVPLQLRRLRVDLDRPGFVRNPTSCEPMAINGSATTSLGQVAPLSTRFQVVGCGGLAFRPKLSLGFGGAIGAGGHPRVRATLRSAKGEATTSSAAFSVPADELLDLRHLRALCPRGLPVDRCPLKSRLGNLRIDTSLLAAPFEGPVYLRVPSHRLPELSADLHSGQLGFVLQGRTIDDNGHFGFSFGSIPDIPISEAVLSLPGGRRGIIVNSRSLCGGRAYGGASLSAHSGATRRVRVPVRVNGCR